MPWITRGLSEGIVTTRYPRRPDGYGPDFHGTLLVDPGRGVDRATERAIGECPTGALSVVDGQVEVDRGRCVLCGRCATLQPEVFRFDPSFDHSTIGRSALHVRGGAEDEETLAWIRSGLARRTKALRRSVHIRHVDAGSDGSEEWEIAALTNPVYDVGRLGIFFTASPHHADILLATGVGTVGMATPLRTTYEAMPHPKVVIAAGVDAASGGMVGPGYASRGGIGDVVPVDVYVPGSPPSPFGLLHGILLAVGLVGTAGNRGTTGRPGGRADRPRPQGTHPQGPASAVEPGDRTEAGEA
ncbi:MAG: NADH-quinone oxidoreductase subunit B family protein [Acidimicrobiales bacterium]|jgi:Ni,Fe-hydrogenase III small subunit/ferredoxin